MRYSTRVLGAVLMAASLAVAVSPSHASGYPEKTITFVVPFGAGGGTDRWARILSSASIDVFGQPLHVRNIPGASAVLGWKFLLDQPADGYTILIGSVSPLIGLFREGSPPFQPDRIKIVSYVSAFRSILLSKPQKPWSTWTGLVDYAKANPKKLTIGGGPSTQLGIAMVLENAGLRATLVPYSGTSGAITDLLGDHIDAATSTESTALSLIPERAVAVINASDEPLSKKTAKKMGNPPLASELGYKDATAFARWIGVHPDTPDEIVEFLSQKFGELLKNKSVSRLIGKIGEEIIFVPREEAQKKYDKLVVASRKGIKLLEKR